MKRLLLFLFIACLSNTFSQDCKCKTYTTKDQQFFLDLVDNYEYKKAYKISKKYIGMKDVNCQLIGYDQQVVIYGRQNMHDSMKLALDKEKDLLKQVPCNKPALLEYTISLAEYYSDLNEIEKGADQYFKALKIAESTKNYARQAYIYNCLMYCFSELKQYKQKLDYAQKSLKIIDKVDDIDLKVDIMNYAAIAYRSNFYRMNSKKGVDSIQILAQKILLLSKKENYLSGIFNGYTLLSDYNNIQKKYDLSLVYLDSAEQLISNSKNANNIEFLYKLFFNKSFVYFEQKKYREAAIASDSLLHYSKMSGQYQILASAYEKCYESYKALGNTNKALEYHELFKKYEDSASNETTISTIQDLEQKYQKAENLRKIEREKQKNKLLTKENSINSLYTKLLLFGIFLIVLILAIIVLIFRQRGLKNKHDLGELENKLNRSRMNPHFFFNALTSLQGIALTENNGKEVAIRLSQFSGLMRKTLESTYSNFITVEEECAFLKDYLEVSRMRNKDFFNYQFKIDEDLFVDEFIVPSMILQPFAENAINHAFKKMKEGGILEIEMNIVEESLQVYIRDNGPGLNFSTSENHTSRAIEITKQRLKLLDKKMKNNFFVELSNRKNDPGVEVFIKLPLLLKHENRDN